MIFDDVRAKDPVINEHLCRGRHNNCNMTCLNRNLFTIDRQSVRENCNRIVSFEQRGKVLIFIYITRFSLIMLNLVVMILLRYVLRYGKSLIIILLLI